MVGWIRRWGLRGLPLVIFVGACDEDLPTASQPGLIPVTAQTVEVRLPFEEFVGELQVQGGYGAAWELASGQVALRFAEELTAHTLIQLSAYPQVATVRDPSGTNRPDSALTFLDGELVVVLDTLSLRGSDEFGLEVGSLDQDWDFRTATWEMSVDSINRKVAWEEAGAGPVRLAGSGSYDPEDGDTVRIAVDSATVADWGDLEDGPAGLRISALVPGSRGRIRSVQLQINTLPSINPDTLIQVPVQARNITFIHTGSGQPDDGSLRVGGAPAWRSVLLMEVADELTGPSELCAALGCPVRLTPDRITYAALVLTSRASPAGFQPRDTLSMDVRPVLAPSLLPRSPLGLTLVPEGRPLPPEFFGPGAAQMVEVPITLFIQDLIRGERLNGERAPTGISLLSSFEPLSLDFHTFGGAGGVDAPVLRILITETNGVNVR
ncbi:MAG: hypothetical protein WEA09_11695 [Gemmatimonadota bacterium]